MSKYAKLARHVFTIGVLALFAWYLWKNSNDFKFLLSISPALIVSIAVLKLLNIANSGQFMKHVLAVYDKAIPTWESFYISLLSSMGNFFGPYLGGASIRAVYLKNKYNFTYTKFMASLSGYYFITFLIYSVLGLVALGVIHVQGGVYSWLVYAALSVWLLSTILLGGIRNLDVVVDKLGGRVGLLRRILHRINEIVKGWRLVKDDKRLVRRLYIITAFGFLISLATSYLEFKAVGAKTVLAPLALYVALATFSMLLSITPSSIGVREAIFIFSSSLLGLTTEQILQIAIIDRGITFLVMAITYVATKLIKPKLITRFLRV